MTVKEFYNWAKENRAEDFEMLLLIDNDYPFEYEDFALDDITLNTENKFVSILT